MVSLIFRIHYVCSNDSSKLRVIIANHTIPVPLTFDKTSGYWIGGTVLPKPAALNYKYALIDEKHGEQQMEIGPWRSLLQRDTSRVITLADSWRAGGIPQRVLDATSLRSNFFASAHRLAHPQREPPTLRLSVAASEEPNLQHDPCVHLHGEQPFMGVKIQHLAAAACVLFRLTDPRINSAGSRVLVCGAIPELGSWRPEAALPMQLVCSECGCWEAHVYVDAAPPRLGPTHTDGSLALPPVESASTVASLPAPWEYKYIVISDGRADARDGHRDSKAHGSGSAAGPGSARVSENSAGGGQRVLWEDGGNRKLDFALLPPFAAPAVLAKANHHDDAKTEANAFPFAAAVAGDSQGSQQPTQRQRRGSYADAVRRGSCGNGASSSCSAVGGEPPAPAAGDHAVHAVAAVTSVTHTGDPHAATAVSASDSATVVSSSSAPGLSPVPLIVVTDNHARLESPGNSWKGAGLSCPLSSLRCAGDAGIGDFAALHAAVRVAHASGFKALHVMPINDTGTASNPYRALSSTALHPIYVNLPAALAWVEGIAARGAAAAAARAATSTAPSSRPTGRGDAELSPDGAGTGSGGSTGSHAGETQISGRGGGFAGSGTTSSPPVAGAPAFIPAALRRRILESSAGGHGGFSHDSEAEAMARLPCASVRSQAAPRSASSMASGSSHYDGAAAAFPLKGQSLSAPASTWPSAAVLSAADGSSSTPSHATRTYASGSDWTRGAATRDTLTASASASAEADAVDWPSVLAGKTSLLRELYTATGEAVLSSRDFGLFFRANREWLQPYALYCFFREVLGSPDPRDWGARARITQTAVQLLTDPGQPYYKAIAFHYWVQAVAHAQLTDVSVYARSLGICLITDVAQSIAATSCDAWAWPHLFHGSRSMAEPPSAGGSREGRDLHVLPLNWTAVAADSDYRWWRMRLNHDAAYFSGLRLTRAHEYFAAYTVPAGSTTGLRGIFDPADGFTAQELLAALPGLIERRGSVSDSDGGASASGKGAPDAAASGSAAGPTAPAPPVLSADSVSLLRRLSEPYIREWTLRAALGPGFAAIAPRFLQLDRGDHDTAAPRSAASASFAGSGGRYQLRDGYRSEGEIKSRLTGTPDDALIAPLVQLLSNACLVPVDRGGGQVPPSASASASSSASATQSSAAAVASAYLQLSSSPTAAPARAGISGAPGLSGHRDLLHGYAFHPRADMHSTTSFLELPADLRDALSRLHALHFSQRMHDLWRVTGYARLSAISRIAGEIGADAQHKCACTTTVAAAAAAGAIESEGKHHSAGAGGHSPSPAGGAGGPTSGGLEAPKATTAPPSRPAAALSPLLLADDQHVRHPALRDVIRHVGFIGSDCHRCPPQAAALGADSGAYDAGPASLLPAAMAGGVGGAGEYALEGTSATAATAAGFHFLHPARMEWASAAAPSWHDMPPLRQWWEDNTAAAWAYYRGFVAPHLVEVEAKLALAAAAGKSKAPAAAAGGAGAALGSGTRAGGGPGDSELPRQCTPDIAAAFFRHYAHGSAALLLWSAADWLAMDGRLRRADAHERIDIPQHEHHEWRWRLPVPLEALAGAAGEDLRSKTRNTLADARRLGSL